MIRKDVNIWINMFNKYQKMKILKNNGNKNGNNRQKNKEKIL